MAEYFGRFRVRWPIPSTMAESDCNAESFWPSPNELPNHPGRVLMTAESFWPSPNELPNPIELRPSGLGRIRVDFLDHFGPSPTEMAE